MPEQVPWPVKITGRELSAPKECEDSGQDLTLGLAGQKMRPETGAGSLGVKPV